MSSNTSRGRNVQKRPKSTTQIFYVAIAVIVVVGLAALGLMVRSQGATPAATTGSVPSGNSQIQTGKNADGKYTKGNPNAKVVVTEYADFQCPGCGFFARSLESAFEEKYVASGQVLFVYHDYPLNIHPNAIPAAQAARCAGNQNAFWPMHDILFQNQAQWSNLPNPAGQFLTYANQLNLNADQFTACFNNKTEEGAVIAARNSGDQLQLSGTPSFAVNGKLIDVNGVRTVNEIVDRVNAAVDAALKQ